MNGKDYSQGGKAYTLLVELVHIFWAKARYRTAPPRSLGVTPEEQKIERFCDAVAAAAFMPRRLVLSFPIVEKSGLREWSDEELRTIASSIGVSRHALLLRLVTLRRRVGCYYKTQRARFDEENRKAAVKEEKKPVPIKRPILLMNWNGRSYTRLVFRSYYDQRITLNDVSSYLGQRSNTSPPLNAQLFN